MPPANIAVTPQEWQTIQNLLEQHVPHLKVWAFGSRARGTPKPYFDLDLALISDQAVGLPTLAAFARRFLFGWPYLLRTRNRQGGKHCRQFRFIQGTSYVEGVIHARKESRNGLDYRLEHQLDTSTSLSGLAHPRIAGRRSGEGHTRLDVNVAETQRKTPSRRRRWRVLGVLVVGRRKSTPCPHNSSSARAPSQFQSLLLQQIVQFVAGAAPARILSATAI